VTTQLTGKLVQTNTGVMQMQVGWNGNHDELDVSGTASLAGTLSVAKTWGWYRDGMTYDIVKTSGNGAMSGSFANVILPQSTPLLSFTVQQELGAVEVDVHAPKFVTVAANGTQFTTAAYLDRLCPTASGDLQNVVAQFQSLSANQFGTALTSLSPTSYDSFAKASYEGTWQYIGSLQHRMSTVRFYSATGQDFESNPLLLAFDASPAEVRALFPSGELSQTQAKNGLWFNGFDQWGDQGGTDGFTGFDYNVYGGTLGFDRAFTDHVTAGISFGYSRTDVDQHFGLADGNVGSWTGSVYGSYAWKNAYVEGAVSYGINNYSNSRYVILGSMEREADSSFGGDAISAYVGGGYYFNVGGFQLGPYAAFNYVYLTEEGFTETGAGSVDLSMSRQSTYDILSDVGLRLARSFKTEEGYLVPQVSAAARYDSGGNDHVITASFAGSPGTAFSVRGPNTAKYGLVPGASLTYIHKSGLSTSLTYSGDFRQNYKGQSIVGQLRYQF